MFHIRNDSINDYRHDYTARFDDRRCGGKDGRSDFLHFFSIRTSRLFIARGNFSGTVRLRFPTKLTFRRACAIVYRRRVIDVWLQNGHARAITKCARVVCQKTKGKIAGRRHPGFFSRSIYWNRLETDPPIRDHGPKEQGESVYRDMGNVSGIRVRPRKRILYRTRIDDTDFLSFSVLIRLIAAYKYSIIRVIECCSMTLGGDVAGRETKENVRPFTRPFLEKLRYRRLRLPFLPYLSLCAHTAIHRARFSFTTTADSCK